MLYLSYPIPGAWLCSPIVQLHKVHYFSQQERAWIWSHWKIWRSWLYPSSPTQFTSLTLPVMSALSVFLPEWPLTIPRPHHGHSYFHLCLFYLKFPHFMACLDSSNSLGTKPSVRWIIVSVKPQGGISSPLRTLKMWQFSQREVPRSTREGVQQRYIRTKELPRSIGLR